MSAGKIIGTVAAGLGALAIVGSVKETGRAVKRAAVARVAETEAEWSGLPPAGCVLAEDLANWLRSAPEDDAGIRVRTARMRAAREIEKRRGATPASGSEV